MKDINALLALDSCPTFLQGYFSLFFPIMYIIPCKYQFPNNAVTGTEAVVH